MNNKLNKGKIRFNKLKKENIMENNKVKIIVADPSALGLFGLAIITLVASSQS